MPKGRLGVGGGSRQLPLFFEERVCNVCRRRFRDPLGFTAHCRSSGHAVRIRAQMGALQQGRRATSLAYGVAVRAPGGSK